MDLPQRHDFRGLDLEGVFPGTADEERTRGVDDAEQDHALVALADDELVPEAHAGSVASAQKWLSAAGGDIHEGTGEAMPGRPLRSHVALYLPVIAGTVRAGRRSEAVAEFVARRVGKLADVETRLFDPRELPFGNLVQREWEMDPQPPDVRAFVEEMARADGFVIVTPEYNYGIPGALKNVLDALYDEWNRKPFGIVGVGGISGGLRAIDALRQVVSGLGAVPVPAHVPVQFVAKEFDERGPVDEAKWAQRIDHLLEEVAWYARALSAARSA